MCTITRFNYVCKYLSNEYSIAAIQEFPWLAMDGIELVETVTSAPTKEATKVKACWNEKWIAIHFQCNDSYYRSDYKNHDDPLYNQDVIEIFIDEHASGHRYIELEISPNNVVFDAIIENDGSGKIMSTNLEWNADGLISKVVKSENMIDYYVAIPVHNFETEMFHGKQLKVNFYRIDEDEDGKREYQAWRPTGAIQYHLPQYFGTLTLQ